MSRVAIVTSAGRQRGTGAAIVRELAEDDRDIGFTCWSGYDDRMPWGADHSAAALEQGVRASQSFDLHHALNVRATWLLSNGGFASTIP